MSNFAIAQPGAKSTKLSGRVIDQNGGTIDSIKIDLVGSSGKIFQTQSAEDGRYSLLLPPGSYSIEANRTFQRGWQNFKIDPYEIPLGDGVFLDICLSVRPASGLEFIGDPLPRGSLPRAALTGTIYDLNGAVVSGAYVVAKKENGQEFQAISNEDGIYVLDLPCNTCGSKEPIDSKYRIAFSARGFSTFDVQNFVFVPGKSWKMNLDVALSIAKTSNVVHLEDL